jgi:hypothetical protein
MDRSKIIIVQFYTSNTTYGIFTETINKQYCDEKGYQYYCEKDDLKIKSALKDRAYTWYKPLLIQEILKTHNPEYVLFMDADAVVSDFNQNIEDFIDEDYDLIFTQDIGHHSAMNAGVFILKNSEWSQNFLKTWEQSAEIYKGKDARDLEIMDQNLEKVGYFKNALWHDQTCLTLLYESDEDIRKHIKIISSRLLNSMERNRGEFIFHAFAYGHIHNRTLDIIHNEKITPDTTNYPNINLIVYHVYCVGNYIEVFQKQLNRLKTSGLYEWCDKLEITCINPSGDFVAIENLVSDLEKVNLNKSTLNRFEFDGINKVWEYSQKYNGKVLYFHTKGVSNSYVNTETKEESSKKKKGVSWWKEIMEYFLIDKYQDCIQTLDNYDQCGVTNINGWWWGNFWWSNLNWARVNNKPSDGDRWSFEAWLNHSRNPKIKEFYHFEFNPYYTSLPNDIYIDLDKYKYSKIEIISAYYGILGEQQDEGRPISERIVIEVTDQIKKNLIENNNRGLNIRVDNSINGDPIFGFTKAIEVDFLVNDIECTMVVDESRYLKFNIE